MPNKYIFGHDFFFFFSYVDDILLISNQHFSECWHVIYTSKIDIKKTLSSWNRDLFFDIFKYGRLQTWIYGKRESFKIPILNFLFLFLFFNFEHILLVITCGIKLSCSGKHIYIIIWLKYSFYLYNFFFWQKLPVFINQFQYYGLFVRKTNPLIKLYFSQKAVCT